MIFEKGILAAITTSPRKVPSGIAVFHCDDEEELKLVSSNLEYILDGIAHEVTPDVFIIVKH
ncbi:capping complex subunit for YIEGIA [Mangrovibacillus cuniculi]|uniref:Uncharacterized protein n=1 Tax=Mangrovibacillus cuniculi TaxID=2593652 RepID=A0A7S8CB27_9BACI|nr:hypothetical protein [Mangrovibacillus cuniculi]QPC46709.1 hypothetical protein G8O30_06910 [Mangrovibacillus cuniculi]